MYLLSQHGHVDPYFPLLVGISSSTKLLFHSQGTQYWYISLKKVLILFKDYYVTFLVKIMLENSSHGQLGIISGLDYQRVVLDLIISNYYHLFAWFYPTSPSKGLMFGKVSYYAFKKHVVDHYIFVWTVTYTL